MYISGMKIINRYIIKEHVGPFVFGLSVIMFILLMNFLVKYIGQIFGKGLPLLTIGKLIFFNLAWMLALAVPMATLIAVLMAYGRFSADNEITILKSSGINIYRIMRPSLYLGVFITLLMIYFNDQVLPEFNHQAKLMLRAVRHKKPTLQLEEQILYQIGNYTFSTAHIDRPLTDQWANAGRLLAPEDRDLSKNDRLRDLIIFDRSNPREDVTILAKEGYMVYSKARKALQFTLFDGEYHQLNIQKPDEYQKSLFRKQTVVIPAKDFMLEERNDSDRGDREMSIAMMKQKVRSFKEQIAIRKRRILSTIYKNFSPIELLLKKTFHPKQKTASSVHPPAISNKKQLAAMRKAANQAERYSQQMRMHHSFVNSQKKSINRYLVEIYKKLSIPFASIVFVLIGAPLGIMARKGNMGVAISLSVGFFLLYWVFLIGGEELADRQFLSPFLAMWAANIIVGAGGLFLTWRAVKETAFINWEQLGKMGRRLMFRKGNAGNA